VRLKKWLVALLRLQVAPKTNGSAPKASAPKEIASAPKTTGSEPKASAPKINGSAPKASAPKNPGLAAGSAPKGPSNDLAEPYSASVFENHIRKSKIRGEAKAYWTNLPNDKWKELETEVTKDLERTINSDDRQKLQSYMTVAYFIRGEFEGMTVQLINLDRYVSAEAISDLGLNEVDFLTQAGKVVGYNNVKIKR